MGEAAVVSRELPAGPTPGSDIQGSVGSEQQIGKVEVFSADPPNIPHITVNYISLGTLLTAVAVRCYTELQNVLRTLNGQSSDSARKISFLNYIVTSRQTLVKLYVLCKWAAVSKEIQRCIDVSNWLHGQQNCFDNGLTEFYHLQQTLNAAKLPQADIQNALLVMVKGSLSHSDYGFVSAEPLSAKSILQTLKLLDVLLAVRLALSEKLPPLYRNYAIHDGRVTFTVLGSFHASFSVADDSVDARFFFVDFHFDFGGAPKVDPGFFLSFEAIVNKKLAAESLRAVLNWILRYCSLCKLILYEEQFKKMKKGLWSGLIKRKNSSASLCLTIEYWIHKPGCFELKIGLKPDGTILAKWLIDGVNHGIPNEALKALLGSAGTAPNVERALQMIQVKHVFLKLNVLFELSFGKGFSNSSDEYPLQTYSSDHRWIRKLDSARLLIQLGPTRTTELTINPSTGFYVFCGNNPAFVLAAQALNVIDNALEALPILERLRCAAMQDTIATRAEAAGWICRIGTRLRSEDVAKFKANVKVTLMLRLPEWTGGWFVLVGIGANFVEWAAVRMTCRQRRWSIQVFHALDVNDEDDPNFEFFTRLSRECSRQFALYEMCEELVAAGVRHSTQVLKEGGDGNGSAGQKPASSSSSLTVYVDLGTLYAPAIEWSFSGLIMQISTASVALKCRSKPGALDMLAPLCDEGLVINPNGIYMITIQRETHIPVLPRLLEFLQRITAAALALRVAKQLNLEVNLAGLHGLELAYTTTTPPGVLVVHGDKIKLGEGNPQELLTPFLAPLLAREGLGSVVRYLATTYELYVYLAKAPVHVLARDISVTILRPNASEDAAQVWLEVRIWRGTSCLYITGNKQARQLSPLQALFTKPSTSGVIPLMQGASVQMDCIDKVLPHIISCLEQK